MLSCRRLIKIPPCWSYRAAFPPKCSKTIRGSSRVKSFLTLIKTNRRMNKSRRIWGVVSASENRVVASQPAGRVLPPAARRRRCVRPVLGRRWMAFVGRLERVEGTRGFLCSCPLFGVFLTRRERTGLVVRVGFYRRTAALRAHGKGFLPSLLHVILVPLLQRHDLSQRRQTG